MSKTGPKRKEGARYPSGRLKEAHDGPTPELLTRRAEVVPIALARTQDAGKALGILYCRTDITWAEMQAGEKLRQSWFRWRSLQGIPPRSQTTRGKASSNDPEWELLDEARKEYEERLNICLTSSKHKELTRAIIETLAFEDIVPPRVYEIGTVPNMIREDIKRSLGALAKFLRIEDRQ